MGLLSGQRITRETRSRLLLPEKGSLPPYVAFPVSSPIPVNKWAGWQVARS